MSKAQLQKAIECLKIQDVFQRVAVSEVSDDFDPKYSLVEEFSIQLKHVVKRSEVLHVEDGDGLCIFRVHVDLGVRWVDVEVASNVVSEEGAKDVEAKEDVLALIEATYIAEYFLEGEPGKEALDEFALKNASFHIWPYWREYIMAQSARMNLPKYTLPVVQFAENRDELPNGDKNSD